MDQQFNMQVIHRYIQLMEDKYHRYWSWDFCFNAFSDNNHPNELALVLAGYLASWGMYRGSGGLLQKNHRIHEKPVKILQSSEYDAIRCTETHEISVDLADKIFNLKQALSTEYRSVPFVRGGKPKFISDTDTLLSKIMLGTMGCVPAYDRYFMNGLKVSKFQNQQFEKAGLYELFGFIVKNTTQVREAQRVVKSATGNHYPVMKIVDMYFWQIGFDASSS